MLKILKLLFSNMATFEMKRFLGIIGCKMNYVCIKKQWIFCNPGITSKTVQDYFIQFMHTTGINFFDNKSTSFSVKFCSWSEEPYIDVASSNSIKMC